MDPILIVLFKLILSKIQKLNVRRTDPFRKTVGGLGPFAPGSPTHERSVSPESESQQGRKLNK